MVEPTKGAVLITGAGTGIGKALALRLDKNGYRVFAGVLGMEEGVKLRAEATQRLIPLVLDITKQDHIAAAKEKVTSTLGPGNGLVGLINNAAIVVLGPLELTPSDQLRRQFEVNIIGHLAMTQAFLDLIRKGRGRIINVGTAGWPLAFPFLGPYTASKAAIAVLTKTLRRELQPWAIPVLLVEPGATATPMWEEGFAKAEIIASQWPKEKRQHYTLTLGTGCEKMKKLYQRAMPPDAAAMVIQQALETPRPKLHYIVGLHAQLGALVAKIIPDRFIDWINARLMAQKTSTL